MKTMCTLLAMSLGLAACERGRSAPVSEPAPAPASAPAPAPAPDAAPAASVAPPATPSTVDEAARTIVAGMADADRKTIRETRRDDLIRYHHGWGTGIRNELGLWQGDSALRSDCARRDGVKEIHPDSCSMQIIDAVWDLLQQP